MDLSNVKENIFELFLRHFLYIDLECCITWVILQKLYQKNKLKAWTVEKYPWYAMSTQNYSVDLTEAKNEDEQYGLYSVKYTIYNFIPWFFLWEKDIHE